MFIECRKNDYPEQGKGTKKRYKKFAQAILIFCLLPFFISGCGSEGSISSGAYPSAPPTEGSSIQFGIEWQNSPAGTSAPAILAEAAIDCTRAGVSTVEAKVYDETKTILAAGEWSCEAHSGTINNVKSGSNRTLVVLAQDARGENIFIGGPLAGITLLPNQSYNAGIIQLIPYSVTLGSPANDSTTANCILTFQWEGALVGGFEIQIDENINFSSPILRQVVSENSYSPANLSPGQYYWRVSALDGLGNPSKWSEAWSFTVLHPIGQPPSAPTGVMAGAGNNQVTITWDDVTGATSYNIYWDTVSGVNKTNGTKIANVTSPYIHTGRSDKRTYYYVVTAVNPCGESVESSEVFARPR